MDRCGFDRLLVHLVDFPDFKFKQFLLFSCRKNATRVFVSRSLQQGDDESLLANANPFNRIVGTLFFASRVFLYRYLLRTNEPVLFRCDSGSLGQ